MSLYRRGTLITYDIAAIEAIEDSRFSVFDQCDLLLVHLGLRPAATGSCLYAEPWREDDEPKLFCDHVLADCADLFRRIGLVYRHDQSTVDLADEEQETTGRSRYCTQLYYTVAASEDTLQGTLSALDEGDDRQLGLALGFPETAIAAFMNETPRIDAVTLEEIRGIPAAVFARFVLSANHWQDELAVTAEWEQAVKQASPLIHSYMMHYLLGATLH